MPSSHDQKVVREKTHAEVARDTVSSLVSREGLLGWFSLVLTLILFISLYLNFEKSERMERFLKEESRREADLRNELIEIQRESVLVREQQSMIMEKGVEATKENVRALENMRIATEANVRLMDVLTREILESGKYIREMTELERKKQARKDAR